MRSGLSLQRFRRLAALAQGSAFEGLPEDWRRVLPRDATLTTLDRWRVLFSEITDWPGSTAFGDRLMDLLSLLDGGAEAARETGQTFLGAKARALWERALLEGSADALLTTFGALAAKDDVEGLTSVVWGSAAAIGSYPRPYVRMIGLNAGSWPRGILEDPLLPDPIRWSVDWQFMGEEESCSLREISNSLSEEGARGHDVSGGCFGRMSLTASFTRGGVLRRIRLQPLRGYLHGSQTGLVGRGD